MPRNNKQNNGGRSRRTKRNRANKNRTRQRPRNINRVVRLSERGRFAPARMFVRLMYEDTQLSRAVTGTSNVMNWRYRSSAYDPDPLLLTGAIPGFVELANLYGWYRVHKMKATVTFANQETQAVLVGGWPGLINHNNNSLAANDVREYSANVRGKSRLLARTDGQSRSSFSIVADLTTLVGPNGSTDLDWASITSSNPVSVFYINFGAVNSTANFSFALPVLVSIEYDIEFFEVRQLET